MAETKHAIVRTDLMSGTDVRSGLVSLKYMGASGDTATDIDNGHVVLLDGLQDSEREIYGAKDPTGSEAMRGIALVCSPEVMYDERERELEDFYNVAGRAARGYRLHDGDIFSVTEEALDGTRALNDTVELQAGTKLNSAASATGGMTSIGKIIAIDKVGRYTYYVIKVNETAGA